MVLEAEGALFNDRTRMNLAEARGNVQSRKRQVV
jgi:hypothetical protein